MKKLIQGIALAGALALGTGLIYKPKETLLITIPSSIVGVTGYLIGRKKESEANKEKHKGDYIEFRKSTCTSTNRKGCHAEFNASIGGKELRWLNIEDVMRDSGLDKVIEEEDTPGVLEHVSDRARYLISGGMFGFPPKRNIDYDIKAHYDTWEADGYGIGYVTSLKLAPKE